MHGNDGYHRSFVCAINDFPPSQIHGAVAMQIPAEGAELFRLEVHCRKNKILGCGKTLKGGMGHTSPGPSFDPIKSFAHL